MKTKPALNEPAQPVKAGVRPYEMEWAGRVEERTPLFGFEDLTGWTVSSEKGADAELVRTNEQRMWGEYVGKLTYTGKSAEGRAIIRPAKPIPIPQAFDCINFWVYGNVWEWAPEPGTPMVDVSVLITDSSGKETSIPLTRVRWKEWWLAHKKLGAPMEGASFSGVEVRGINNAEARSILFDSIYFYKEALKPLEFEPRPARNLKLFAGQDQGLNGTGKGKLPFPTREETILPTNFEKEWSNTVTQTAPGKYEFAYKAKDCEVKYIYEPATGSLGEITAYVNGKKTCVPMFGGGIEGEDSSVMPGNSLKTDLKNGVLTAVFEMGGGQAEYSLRIWQKSLVMDFICRGGKAGGVSLGELREVTKPKLVLIPFLTFGVSNPRVLCFGDVKDPRFASVWVDWYRSNGSTLWSQEWAGQDSAKINGGVRYYAKTDGKRNDLYERVFLTVSPTFEETLPTVANPPSPRGKEAGERLWQESWGPDNYAKQHERSKMLRSYGIDMLTQCNHEITWRDEGESFTLRTKAAPGKGGDEALKKYVADQQSLGWRSGLYTNYTDFAPVNEHWDEDYVQLTQEGEWRPAWPRNYALKPSRAVELDAKLAPQVQRKYGSNAAYTDVHTAVAPWGYCDFDARVPGAGTFAATFYAYGELLWNDQKVYGPIWSEGTYHWLYAGLASGNYGLQYGGVDLSKEPLNVAFDLMKIHPLECDIGMPWTGGFFKTPGWDKPENLDRSIDQFIATTIAYGHIGWLVEEHFGIQRTCRSYYMLQQLQKRYAMQKPVGLIGYVHERRGQLTASQAIAEGLLQDSVLYVLYDGGGLHLYVNASSVEARLDDKVVLPPWGWLAYKPGWDSFWEVSGLVNGVNHRIDYVQSPEYDYLDGRGAPTVYGGMAVNGAIAVRRAKDKVEVTDVYGNDEFGVKLNWPALCTVCDADGKSLRSVAVRYPQDGLAWVKTVDKARRYVFTRSEGAGAGKMSIEFPRDIVVPGEECNAKVNASCLAGVRVKSISLEVTGSAPKMIELQKPGNKVSGVIQATFPRDLAPGSRVWVRSHADTEDGKTAAEGWYVLKVVEPFDVAVKEAGSGRFEVSARTNLNLPAHKPNPRVKLKSGEYLTLKQDGNAVTVEPAGVPQEASDAIVVSLNELGWNITREFPIRTVIDYPTVWQLGGNDGFEWGQCFRGGKEMPGNTATGATFINGRSVSGGVTKQAIFAHPPYNGGVGYTYGFTGSIYIPDKPCDFRAFIGITDGGNPSDGVTFTVLAIDDQGKEHKLFSEHYAERKWKEITADLSAFRGRSIRLKLTTDVGPKDNSVADWAAWGEPRIVTREPEVRVELGGQ